MFTIDTESVNGGIYRSREQAATLRDARRIVREGLRGLSCFYQVFIADADTGRRVQRGVRERRGGWSWYPVKGITREELREQLSRLTNPDKATVIADLLAADWDEYKFTRTDDYGPLRWRARRYEDGTYALDKIPA